MKDNDGIEINEGDAFLYADMGSQRLLPVTVIGPGETERSVIVEYRGERFESSLDRLARR